MSDAAKFPQPLPTDSEDVSWALSTGQAMWSRGDTSEAIRWVKRASESAADASDDDRALALARVAADLKVLTGGSVMPPALPPEPPKPQTAAPPPPARVSTGTPPPPATRAATGVPPAPSPSRSQTGAPPRQTGAPPPARGSAPMPTAGRTAPATSPKIPLPTAGTRQALSPAKRPAPTPSPARAVPIPTTAHAHEAKAAPAFERDTAIPGDAPDDGDEVFPRHEAPTAGGSSAPPPRAQMPTPTEVFSTIVPREAFADHEDDEPHHEHYEDEEPSAADDGPTAAVSFEKLEPRHHAPVVSPRSAPGLASSPVWLVRRDDELHVVVANGARPDGAIDAVIVANAADLAAALRR